MTTSTQSTQPRSTQPVGEPRQGASPPPPGASPANSKRPWFRPSGRWIVFFVALLALNSFFGMRASEPASRVRVPYSPFFLDQVRADHVASISSKGTAIQGTFAKKLSYEGSKPTEQFRTEIPAFANTDSLSNLLEEHGVTVNAQPLDKGLPWWQTGLVAFGPTILFVLLLFWLMRRAGNVQNALGSFGRSSARRYQPAGDRVTFADVAGIDEAKGELSEVVDFLRHPEKYQPARRPDPARRAALRASRHGQDAARAGGRRRGGGAVLLDGRLRVRRGVRRRRRVACARPVQTGEGGRARDHLHRRARRDRPLADERGRGLQRRQRRARADAQPDPHRDGRLRLVDRA